MQVGNVYHRKVALGEDFRGRGRCEEGKAGRFAYREGYKSGCDHCAVTNLAILDAIVGTGDLFERERLGYDFHFAGRSDLQGSYRYSRLFCWLPRMGAGLGGFDFFDFPCAVYCGDHGCFHDFGLKLGFRRISNH